MGVWVCFTQKVVYNSYSFLLPTSVPFPHKDKIDWEEATNAKSKRLVNLNHSIPTYPNFTHNVGWANPHPGSETISHPSTSIPIRPIRQSRQNC